MHPRKIVLIGDSKVGKSTIVARYRKTTPPPYRATVFDMVSDDRFSLVDTDGDDSYILLRPLCYHQVRLAIIVFSLNDRTSFERVSYLWLPELRQFFKGPCVLLGTKNDLKHTVTREEIATLVAKQNLVYFTLGNLQHHELDKPNREAETRIAELFDAIASFCPLSPKPTWKSYLPKFSTWRA